MKKNNKMGKVYKSMEEFEKKFFPNSFKDRLIKSMDIRTQAVTSAKESLERIRQQLKG
ncbi:MAG: hypothetical protein KAW92_05925 [Candidatus Cloacimonetes bacterium]|nr:hypothetical protein [Candidatus Cloacimonadota bacterium]